MGRPPSNGGPVFRFHPTEVAEMETILQEHNTQMPAREVIVALAERFSASVERSGKIVVQMKQVWNWFTNRRHALRAKAKYPRMLNVSPIAWDDSNAVRNAPQAPQSVTAPVNPSLYVSLMPWDDPTAARNVHQAPKSITAPAVQSAGRTISDKYLMEFEAKSARDGAILPSLSFSAVQSPGITISDKYHMEFEAKSARDGAILPSLSFSALQSPGRTVSDKYHMEFEAKSARDGAWYDVAMFMSHRSLKTGDADVLVRFAGLGPEEDEWVNIHMHVRPRSLPCEPSECAAVLPGDLILCFQEGQEQGRYFDAHILDVRKRRHDLRGCRCRFRVRYDHDQSEEIVPLRKICRRPETDYRFRQLRGIKKSGSVNRQKIGADAHTGDTLRAYSSTEPMQKQQKVEEHADAAAMVLPPGNVPIAMEPEVQPKITEISTSDNVVTSMVPPANVAVTSGDAANTITGGSMVPPANVVVTNGDATNTITGGSGQVGTSMVPPANVVVTSVDAANTITGGSGPTS